MTPLAALATAWGSTYANHAAVRTLITFAHVASLVVGGGAAIAADRATLFAGAHASDETSPLGVLQTTHRVVIGSLALIVFSGLLMFAADLDSLFYSRVFWIKMAVVALLLMNGAVLWAAEQRAWRRDRSAWRRLHQTAVASVVLWLLATLAGVALLNIG